MGIAASTRRTFVAFEADARADDKRDHRRIG
jgi:hypothetical protein